MRIIACKHEKAIYTSLSQIIPFCERANRLKNAILKPKFTQLLLQTANLNRKMGRTEKKNPP